MAEQSVQESINFWKAKIINLVKYLCKSWYYWLGAAILSGFIGYLMYKPKPPVFTANFTFVLSTEQKGNNGLAGLAAQLGFDATTASSENIFSGDNIIEFFKSRQLIGEALMSEVDTVSHQTLLNYIFEKNYNNIYKKIGPIGRNPKQYNRQQVNIYRKIITYVGQSFTVFKKDKKLIFYIITARSTNPDIAYFIAKYMLDQTSDYFISTKTKVAATSVELLKKEADSLSIVLRNMFSSSAALIDRTYNLNPSVTIQRSSSQFTQAKANAISLAYTEVMRNLEVAKMSLQKETPLYRIIDEPELPLSAIPTQSVKNHIIRTSLIGFFSMIILLVVSWFYEQKNKNVRD
jgi:hypothetical protein